MFSIRHIVPALALAGSVIAQCGEEGSTMTIQSNADASGLSGCTTFTGSIAISTGTTDNIQLSGIRRITGSLIANNVTQMTSLAATDLEEIGQEFNLESLTILSTLNFPKLTKVDSISWTALPALQGLSFATGVQEVNMLTIDNTQLNALDGINLQVAETISVTNNPYLDKVSMQLGNVTQSLTFGANGRNLEAEFPNLEWAYNMTFRDCAKVSIPSLSSVNGSLGFYENGLESVSAPNLTNVGGSLAFVRNDQLSNITMPELTTIGGGFLVANNTGLGEINGFPALKTVGGALDFNGAFESVDLPELGDVRGAFNLQSSKNLDKVCDHFSGLSGNNGVIKGEYTCSGEESSPGGAGTLPDGTNSGGGSSTSASAAVPMFIPYSGVLGVVAAIFGLL